MPNLRKENVEQKSLVNLKKKSTLQVSCIFREFSSHYKVIHVSMQFWIVSTICFFSIAFIAIFNLF
jgi:hypothetical protein